MSVTPNYVPREYKTINVILIVKDAQQALKFYNSAFGAEITLKLIDPKNGKVVHAEMRIEDTIIMVAEEDLSYYKSPETSGGTGVVIKLYTGDVEGVYENAVNAGAEEVRPIEEQFYGDRAGMVRDPFGHQWIIATCMETLAPSELHRRFNELYS